jgi:hypothetical protein
MSALAQQSAAALSKGAMKLFFWPFTKSNQLYASGKIVVMAASVEQARETAMRQVRSCTSFGYKDMPTLIYYAETDADDRRELEEVLHQLRLDLEKDPIVHETPTAIFINGSE